MVSCLVKKKRPWIINKVETLLLHAIQIACNQSAIMSSSIREFRIIVLLYVHPLHPFYKPNDFTMIRWFVSLNASSGNHPK